MKNATTHLIIGALLVVLFGCEQPKWKKEPAHRLGIRIENLGEIARGDELVVKLLSEKEGYEIVSAYHGCNADGIVDFDLKKLAPTPRCQSNLLVEDGTVWIGFRPSRTGKYQFGNVLLCVQDRDGIVYLCDTSFGYSVR